MSVAPPVESRMAQAAVNLGDLWEALHLLLTSNVSRRAATARRIARGCAPRCFRFTLSSPGGATIPWQSQVALQHQSETLANHTFVFETLQLSLSPRVTTTVLQVVALLCRVADLLPYIGGMDLLHLSVAAAREVGTVALSVVDLAPPRRRSWISSARGVLLVIELDHTSVPPDAASAIDTADMTTAAGGGAASPRPVRIRRAPTTPCATTPYSATPISDADVTRTPRWACSVRW